MPSGIKRSLPKKYSTVATKIVEMLSKEYEVETPLIGKLDSKRNLNGCYNNRTKTIYMHSRNHIKTIFHEWYHHLDNVTNRKYNSSDRSGGRTSLGWQFADLLWEKFRL
jgi:hypothetical protein